MMDLWLIAKVTAASAAGLLAARMARRGPAARRHLVLASTFCALLALPLVASLVPVLSIEIPIAAVGERMAPAQPADPVGPPPQAPQRASGATSRNDLTIPSWPTLLRAAWVVGATLVLAPLVIGLMRLGGMKRTGVPWLEMREPIRTLAEDAGIRRHVDLILHEGVAAPFACGLRHPTILMPMDAPAWSEADRRRAIVHELEHVRRGDWSIQILARAACAFYWFHPLVWVAWRQLCLEAERACDDAVIQGTDHTDYAEQLVVLARRLKTVQDHPALGMARRSDLSRRVSALLDASQQRGRAGVWSIAAALGGAAAVVLAIAPVRAVLADAARPQIILAEGATPRAAQPERAGRLDRALFRAAQRGDLDRITELLNAGANVNAALVGDGSPLIGAAGSGRAAAVSLLLDRGGDPNMAVSGDGNPIIAAANAGHAGIVAMLLDRGALIDQVVPGDENALIQASGEGHLEVVNLLIARGADVNARVWADQGGDTQRGEWRTPLSMARQARHDGVVKVLRAAGARD
jgi:beta-lactamase regulating signal transducer with metallopeptidase domain